MFHIGDYTYSTDIHECQSERNFKTAKYIFTALRSRLSPEKGEYQALLGDYYRKGKPSFGDKMCRQ
jgi:hypothetical protein